MGILIVVGRRRRRRTVVIKWAQVKRHRHRRGCGRGRGRSRGRVLDQNRPEFVAACVEYGQLQHTGSSRKARDRVRDRGRGLGRDVRQSTWS